MFWHTSLNEKNIFVIKIIVSIKEYTNTSGTLTTTCIYILRILCILEISFRKFAFELSFEPLQLTDTGVCNTVVGKFNNDVIIRIHCGHYAEISIQPNI